MVCKLLPGLMLLVFLFGIPGGTVVKSEPMSEKAMTPLMLSQADPEVKAVFSHTVESFALYSSFLGDCTQNGDYLVPLHGANQPEALTFLGSGFTADLAAAIVEECTVYNSDLGCLVINPGDGIPVLTAWDRPDIWLTGKSENRIIFLRKYNNCYAEGDEYHLLVTMSREETSWKVSDISFMAINDN